LHSAQDLKIGLITARANGLEGLFLAKVDKVRVAEYVGALNGAKARAGRREIAIDQSVDISIERAFLDATAATDLTGIQVRRSTRVRVGGQTRSPDGLAKPSQEDVRD
jgi:hypothetical protein